MTEQDILMEARKRFKESNRWNKIITDACDRGDYDDHGYLRPFIREIESELLRRRAENTETE